MCVHARSTTTEFQSLESKMAEHGYVPLIFADGTRNYSMFVNPKHRDSVRRAFTDLSKWHPNAAVTDRSLNDIAYAPGSVFAFKELCDDRVMLIPDRNVPDSLDLEEKDFGAVYNRCYANGYFTEKMPVAIEAG